MLDSNMSAAAISGQTPLRDCGKLLRKFRKQYGIKLVEFGKLCKISQPMLSQFERGDHNLSDEAWTRVLEAMGKLLLEDENRRKEERAKASETAAKLGVKPFSLFSALESEDGLFGSLLGI